MFAFWIKNVKWVWKRKQHMKFLVTVIKRVKKSWFCSDTYHQESEFLVDIPLVPHVPLFVSTIFALATKNLDQSRRMTAQLYVVDWGYMSVNGGASTLLFDGHTMIVNSKAQCLPNIQICCK